MNDSLTVLRDWPSSPSRDFPMDWRLTQALSVRMPSVAGIQCVHVPEGSVWKHVWEFEVVKSFVISHYRQGKVSEQLVPTGQVLRAQAAYSNNQVIASNPFCADRSLYVPLEFLQLTAPEQEFLNDMCKIEN